jgi:hypothetical protein
VVFGYARPDPGRARALIEAYRDAGGPATVSRRGHFSMLIAQLGHITEIAATDWLEPNVRSPERADAAVWIGEGLDEPHTRELLDTLLAAVGERDCDVSRGRVSVLQALRLMSAEVPTLSTDRDGPLTTHEEA